jgi:hypothetical protein
MLTFASSRTCIARLRAFMHPLLVTNTRSSSSTATDIIRTVNWLLIYLTDTCQL